MNYAIFGEWVRDRVEELVSMGFPRETVEQHARYLRNGLIAAKAEAENDDQLLLEFKEIGGCAMAERHGVSERAIRKRREKILRKRERNQMRNQIGRTASA
jgi:hypothetical protein